jgi:4-hydroxy-3-polyprenylbenzoate decarboxylase
MRAPNHAGAINGKAHHALKKDMPVAVCVGGPTLDQISSMMRLPGAHIDGWDKLGGFLGGPAEVVNCETVDLTVPANAEIVLEGHVITSEGFIHDEGPYGEATGTYGVEWLGHNWNLKVECVTYRRKAIYQHASIAGLHPGRTDMYIWLPSIEGELFETLQRAGVQVLDVHMPPASCENIAYARIKPVSGGDAKQALGAMLTACRQHFPKIAYVFDEDIDIYDDEQVKWAQAWRYNPGTGTLLIPGQNINPLDPSITMTQLPVSITKIGFDCTMPLGQDNAKFARAMIVPPIEQPADVVPLSEDEIDDQLRELIRESPRGWREILTHFAGQPYPNVYRAFGRLRPQLGRMADEHPEYPYTFAETEFVPGGRND